MKEHFGRVELRNRATGELEPADVFQELDDKNFDDFEKLWKPHFPSPAPDSHWDWVGKARHAASLMAYETFALECDGDTQGLMLVNLTLFARLDSQKGRDLVYVELLATAPWNRRTHSQGAKYRGVGPLLIATAIRFSFDQGFNGRIGLHSLATSESWYRDVLRLTDCGYDSGKKMRYFEMTDEQATAFFT